jgi:hypothetical protein
MKLVDKRGCKVAVGTIVRSFRGEVATVHGITRPHKPASTGRVYVRFSDDEGTMGEYFPSVFGLTWVDREDR